jgi:hypothetical protein
LAAESGGFFEIRQIIVTTEYTCARLQVTALGLAWITRAPAV